MKNLILFIMLLISSVAHADVKISGLPLNSTPSSINTNDSFPYVNSTGSGLTQRLLISALPLTPSFVNKFALYAPINNPTFTGITTGYFSGPLTGNVTGNLTGNASTATALASTPTGCSTGQYASSIAANGNLTCAQVSYSQLSGSPTLSNYLAVANNLSDLGSRQTALNTLAGGATTGNFLRGNGTNILLGSIQASDVPTLNQNTTGNASNVTGTSNSTLTTLSALSLPYGQLSGTVPTWNQNTSGTSANVTGTVGISNGGTGQTSASSAINALVPTQSGNSGTYLTTNGTSVSWAALSALPSQTGQGGNYLTTNGTTASWAAVPVGFSNPMTTLGDMMYENSTPAAARVAGNITTTKQFLTQTGTGSVSAAPGWGNILAADVPTLNQNTTGTSANITGTTNTTLTSLANLATVGTIGTGTWNATTIAIAKGGTGQVAAPTTNGVVYAASGTAYGATGAGGQGQILGNYGGAPIWKTGYQGPKNYILYNDFENNATTGWSLGTVGTLTNAIPTGTPTFGSGANGALSISTTGVTPIGGTYTLQYVSTAATTVGNMLASNAYTIETEDQAKVLNFKFSYLAKVGSTAMNFSGTKSNTFGVALWDATNSQWLSTVGNFCATQNSGVGSCVGTFQTAATTASIRLVIYNANASTAAATLYFDNFSVGPQSIPTGLAGSDWQTYSPTLTTWGTGSPVLAAWRRVGDSMEIQAVVASGASPTGTTTFPLPTGFTIDNSNVKISNTNYQIVGSMVQDSQTVTVLPIAKGGGTSIYFGYYSSATTTGSQPQSVVPANVQNSFSLKVPIQGWGSNLQLSSDTTSRVISWTGNAGTNALTSGSDIALTTVTDGSGSWNGTQFVVPVAGDYLVSGNFGANVSFTPGIFLNGVQYNGAFFSYAPAGFQASGAGLVIGCKPGDKISVRPNGTGTLYSGGLGIFRLSGPSVIAANESVNLTVGLATGNTFSGNTPLIYDTKIKDSHNGYSTSTGIYTVPVSGQYRISATFWTSTSGGFGIWLRKNGAGYMYLTQGATSTVVNGSISIPLLAGDQIAVATDGAAVTLQGNAAFINNFSLERTGN